MRFWVSKLQVKIEILFNLLSNLSSPQFFESCGDFAAGCEASSELLCFTAQTKGKVDAKLNRCDVLASLNISDCKFCGS